MRTVIDFSPLVVGLGSLDERARQALPQELDAALTECSLLAQGELQQRLPKGAAGRGGGAGLAGSVSWDVQQSGAGAVAEIGSPLDYAEYVEYGTRPHRPPVAALQLWVGVVLGLQGVAGRSAAYAIGQKIARTGTRAQPVWQPTFDALQSEFRGKVAAAMDRVLGRLPT